MWHSWQCMAVVDPCDIAARHGIAWREASREGVKPSLRLRREEEEREKRRMGGT